MRPLGWLLTWGSGAGAAPFAGGGAETWVREITVRRPRSFARARDGRRIVQVGGFRNDDDPQVDTDHRRGGKG